MQICFKNNLMKILYALQGTGNGHLARATEIIPILKQMAETDIVVSGIQGDIQLPFEVKYKLYGMSFIFGKTGGVDVWATIRKMKLFRFFADMIKLPVKKYDLVISDFEPVTAWACKLKNKRCVGLSHQNAVLHKNTPKPGKSDLVGELILKYYAPSAIKYGFHFEQLDSFNFPPVIRSEIRNATVSTNNHFTVYLPSYSNEEIEKILSQIPEINWEVFSKHSNHTYTAGNIHFQPVSAEAFRQSFVSCSGILCNAGFETPAEALFMGKKLCVIPMKNQYEQACNAAFMARFGIPVLTHLHESTEKIKYWATNSNCFSIRYPDLTAQILEKIILRNNI